MAGTPAKEVTSRASTNKQEIYLRVFIIDLISLLQYMQCPPSSVLDVHNIIPLSIRKVYQAGTTNGCRLGKRNAILPLRSGPARSYKSGPTGWKDHVVWIEVCAEKHPFRVFVKRNFFRTG
jgi:hypothetical protein